MPDLDNTETEEYRLVNLMVDGKPVQFIRATITRTITWIGGPGARLRETRWYGEIVSTKDDPEVDLTALVHDLVAETADGHVVEGYFTVTSWHPEGFELVGSGELTIS
jgi:hypothetical protein